MRPTVPCPPAFHDDLPSIRPPLSSRGAARYDAGTDRFPSSPCRGDRMRRAAVIGVGVTKFGKHDRTSAELFAQAAAGAIRDADLAPSAIQALYYGNVTGGE